MKVTFLGTGTSQGVPIIACDCEVCSSPDSRDKRLRSAIYVETPQASLVVDTGPDFRYQMLRANIRRLDAVLLTHSHKDHIAGLDDIRAYNFFQERAMDIYSTPETQSVLRREFSYVFENQTYPGIPLLNLQGIGNEAFSVNGLPVLPIRVLHYKMEVFGFRFGDFTYITDANSIAPEELDKCRGSKVLVLNALRHEPHISHYTLAEAIEVAQEIGAETTYFTHISHQLGLHVEVEAMLPAGMHLSYDGMQLIF